MNVTLLYAGLAVLVLLVLSWRVVRLRRSLRIGLGDGGNADLQRATRVHGNFLEYTPIALLLLALLEFSGLASVWLHAGGVALLVFRSLHAFGLSSSAGTSFGRFAGTLGTWLLLAALAVTAVVRALA
ncbi:MAG: MAPEG family protein [Gammaproteobacteria bacterium]|nr:MAPEG family protein [Gammaproteobacteria bacterium]